MHNKIDQFGIGAASLEAGVSALQALLGVETPRGGKHDMMSAHNCVCRRARKASLKSLRLTLMRRRPAVDAGSVWMIQQLSHA